MEETIKQDGKQLRHIVDVYKNWQPSLAAYDKWNKQTKSEDRKLQAIMEMAGEATEVLQLATKARRKGLEIPREKVLDELGDTWWGLVGIMNEFGISFSELCESNMEKLNARYNRAGFGR